VLCVTRAILESGGVQLPAIAAHLRRWAESRDYRQPSGGLRRFLIRLRRGGPWDACAVSGWRGRGGEALLASVPLAARLWADREARGIAVERVLRLSQRGRGAAEAARLAADVLAWALVAEPEREPALAEMAGGVRRRSLRKRLRALERRRAEPPQARRPARPLRGRPRASQIVAAALEAADFGSRPFSPALEAALAWGEAGRHASILAGALVGARQGEGALPADLLRRLEEGAGIARLAEALGGIEAAQQRGLIPALESAAAAFGKRAWRAARIFVGVALLVLGLAGLFLPFLQGVLLIFSGLAVLGAEFRWARDMLRRLRVLLKRGMRRLRASRGRRGSG